MRAAVIAIVVILVLALAAAGAAFAAPSVLKQMYPVPAQPFTFPHDLHAGAVGLDCQFCHRNVAQGAAATVPSVEQCMFCHSVIRKDAPSGIAVVRDMAAKGEPITWTRVHRVPDHVRFWHEPHIRVLTTRLSQERSTTVVPSEVCSTCHGDVKTVKQVEQVRDLRMNDCVDCHRANNAPTDCAVCHF